MRNNDIEEAIDLLFRLPRIMHTSLQREIFKPPLKSLGEDLAPHHMAVMKLLEEEGTLHISEIGDTLAVAKAQMTHAIDKLTALGMIERLPDTEDRRKTGVRLTEQGRNAVMKIDRALKKHMKERLSWLQDEELARVMEALKYLVATFERLK